MIVIAGTVRVRPDRRADAMAAARAMAAATLREPGCRAYRFAIDLDDPDVVHLFEEWTDGDALARHFGTPHMATFQAAIAGALAEVPAFRRYEVSSAGPLAV
jgi:quinol monooxygenase YgiN